MFIFRLKKKSGGERVIYSPNPEEKKEYKKALPAINKKAKEEARFAHAFIPGRSPITNAEKHIGYEWTLSCDLKDFFDSVSPEMVENFLTPEEMELVFYNGAPRQGLPTSPPVANLAAVEADEELSNTLSKILSKGDWVYTRYADDLSLSWNGDGKLHKTILEAIEQIFKKFGFLLSRKKTRLQWARFGRRIICGVAVDNEKGLCVPRRTRRKLRAALHQNPNSNHSRGLKEWCQLKFPKERGED